MKQFVVAVSVAVLALALGACGSGEDEAAESAQAPSSAASSSSAAPALTLREACPEVEAAMPGGMLPPASRWEQFSADLDALAEQGDTETQNALAGLQDSAEVLASDPANGSPLVDATQAYLTSLDNFADRCRAVGSSALR